MNRVKVKVTGEGEFDLKWLVQWSLRIILALLALLTAIVGGKIVIHL